MTDVELELDGEDVDNSYVVVLSQHQMQNLGKKCVII